MWQSKARSASLREFFASKFHVGGQRSLLPPTSDFVPWSDNAVGKLFQGNDQYFLILIIPSKCSE